MPPNAPLDYGAGTVASLQPNKPQSQQLDPY